MIPEGANPPTCDRCFQPILDPDGHGLFRCPFEPRPHQTTRYFQDQVPGGLVVENFAPYPMTFDSHSAKRAYMKAHGIREHVEHVGVPGSDKSPHTTRQL